MKIKGIVENISGESIEGWVIVYDNENEIIEEPKVKLKVNGKTVAITFAVRQIEHGSNISSGCGFKFLIKDLFNYLNKDDEITISTYDDNIPIYKHGLTYKCKTSGVYDVNHLFRKLDEDYVFDVKGELKLSLKKNEELRKKTIQLYSELRNLFEEECSYQLYACYGTLLGIVREKYFISNDGNFDCAYFSKKSIKDEVIEEFKAISKILIKNGYFLKVLNSSENRSDRSRGRARSGND